MKLYEADPLQAPLRKEDNIDICINPSLSRGGLVESGSAPPPDHGMGIDFSFLRYF